MSTRSRIGAIQTDGTIKSIYCHSDGHPDRVGATLVAHYRDPAKIAALLALGDLSSLGAECQRPPAGHSFNDPARGHTVAYRRDRGEQRARMAQTHRNEREFLEAADGCNYAYLIDTDGSILVTDLLTRADRSLCGPRSARPASAKPKRRIRLKRISRYAYDFVRGDRDYHLHLEDGIWLLHAFKRSIKDPDKAHLSSTEHGTMQDALDSID